MSMEERTLETSEGTLQAHYREPTGTNALVVFVHGTGSSRDSRRNRAVAKDLWEGGIGTLLVDLLTPEEQEEHPEGHFHLDSHSRKVLAVVETMQEEAVDSLRVGLFGSSTGAAVALHVAVQEPEAVHALVSRGGRPDLVEERLARVRVPTLFLVGEKDREVLRMNREAVQDIQEGAVAKLEVIPEAGHLFEEPGALQMVARRSLAWFEEQLVKGVPFSPSEAPGDRGTEPGP
jgi:pimeloyl-ACP methyl ester carboxylesterase